VGRPPSPSNLRRWWGLLCPDPRSPCLQPHVHFPRDPTAAHPATHAATHPAYHALHHRAPMRPRWGRRAGMHSSAHPMPAFRAPPRPASASLTQAPVRRPRLSGRGRHPQRGRTDRIRPPWRRPMGRERMWELNSWRERWEAGRTAVRAGARRHGYARSGGHRSVTYEKDMTPARFAAVLRRIRTSLSAHARISVPNRYTTRPATKTRPFITSRRPPFHSVV